MKLECSECGNDLKRINDIKELSVVPYDWYKHPKVFKNEIILFCENCNYFKMLSSWDRFRYRIANRIMGLNKNN